ncbi:MAG: hypothetical protein ACTSX6_01575 [Candidatus Heimdallarchaeaceae archaeon]
MRNRISLSIAFVFIYVLMFVSSCQPSHVEYPPWWDEAWNENEATVEFYGYVGNPPDHTLYVNFDGQQYVIPQTITTTAWQSSGNTGGSISVDHYYYIEEFWIEADSTGYHQRYLRTGSTKIQLKTGEFKSIEVVAPSLNYNPS